LRAAYPRLRARADALAGELASAGVDAYPSDCEARVGGGGAPTVTLPSAAVSLPAELAGPLRQGRPPVVGRVAAGRCLLDLRAVAPEEDSLLFEAVRAAAGRDG